MADMTDVWLIITADKVTREGGAEELAPDEIKRLSTYVSDVSFEDPSGERKMPEEDIKNKSNAIWLSRLAIQVFEADLDGLDEQERNGLQTNPAESHCGIRMTKPDTSSDWHGYPKESEPKFWFYESTFLDNIKLVQALLRRFNSPGFFKVHVENREDQGNTSPNEQRIKEFARFVREFVEMADWAAKEENQKADPKHSGWEKLDEGKFEAFAKSNNNVALTKADGYANLPAFDQRAGGRAPKHGWIHYFVYDDYGLNRGAKTQPLFVSECGPYIYFNNLCLFYNQAEQTITLEQRVGGDRTQRKSWERVDQGEWQLAENGVTDTVSKEIAERFVGLMARGTLSEEDYRDFFWLVRTFINQAERNQSEETRSPELPRNDKPNSVSVTKTGSYSTVAIGNYSIDCHLKNNTSYGPTAGEGGMVPYLCSKIGSGTYLNVRVRWQWSDGGGRRQPVKIIIVVWDAATNDDTPTGCEYDISGLGLDAELPGEKFREFIDTYTGMLEEKKRMSGDMVKELAKKLERQKNIILRGAPGTGKTWLARHVAEYMVSGGNASSGDESAGAKQWQVGFVQFHPSYDYTDFVEGLRPVTAGGGVVGFALKPGVFKEFCGRAKRDSGNNYVFIIDEINRGEISKIFGELFFSLDPGYRGEAGKVSTQYANLHDEYDPFYEEVSRQSLFYIPKNVYIIGTMNDIDRSVDTFDFAMRRRFQFIEVKAEEQVAMLEKNLDGGLSKSAKDRMTALNKAISDTDGLNENYHIGPSYFLDLGEKYDTGKEFEQLWDYQLKSLLQEYVRGMDDEADRMTIFKDAYDLKEKETETDEDESPVRENPQSGGAEDSASENN